MCDVDHISCRDCKFMSKAGKGRLWNTCPKQFPDNRYRPAKPTFACDWHGWTAPCKYVEPIYPQLKQQTEDYPTFIQYYIEQWLPKPLDKSTVAIVEVSNPDIVYRVKLQDWLDCSIFDDAGELKTTERYYYKQCRSGFGYKLVYEDLIDGVWRVRE